MPWDYTVGLHKLQFLKFKVPFSISAVFNIFNNSTREECINISPFTIHEGSHPHAGFLDSIYSPSTFYSVFALKMFIKNPMHQILFCNVDIGTVILI